MRKMLFALFVITNMLRVGVFVLLSSSAWATEQITGYGDVSFDMTKSELEKKLNKRSEVWIGDIQKLNRQATILGNSYQIIYFTHGERIVSIQILNLGILKLADSPDSSQGIWTRWYCEAYVEYIYSSLVRKYGNSALPLKTKVISEPDEFYKYDATFSSSNGGWLSFTGLYDRSVDGQRMRKVFGQEGACILSLTYRSPEPLGEGF